MVQKPASSRQITPGDIDDSNIVEKAMQRIGTSEFCQYHKIRELNEKIIEEMMISKKDDIWFTSEDEN